MLKSEWYIGTCKFGSDDPTDTGAETNYARGKGAGALFVSPLSLFRLARQKSLLTQRTRNMQPSGRSRLILLLLLPSSKARGLYPQRFFVSFYATD